MHIKCIIYNYIHASLNKNAEVIKLILTISLFGISILSYSQDEKKSFGKINGMSFVAGNKTIDSTHVKPMLNVGTNWVATIPFAYMPTEVSPELQYDLEWQWIGERLEGTRQQVQEIHQQNLSVMIKPQIWIGHGTYTGEISMTTEEEWLKLEKNYTNYILDFIKIAKEENVEMFCIGTELREFVANRPYYWVGLIEKIKMIYAGQLTYAANWDDFDDVQFWNNLDYIGVDAYFPIGKERDTDVDDLKKGWKKHLNALDTAANQFNKQILFTEYGYRSMESPAVKPWDYSTDAPVDMKAQCIALEALYQSVWHEEKFAGGFLWKWHADNQHAGGKRNNMFTVQNKAAMDVIRKYYN